MQKAWIAPGLAFFTLVESERRARAPLLDLETSVRLVAVRHVASTAVRRDGLGGRGGVIQVACLGGIRGCRGGSATLLRESNGIGYIAALPERFHLFEGVSQLLCIGSRTGGVLCFNVLTETAVGSGNRFHITLIIRIALGKRGGGDQHGR